MLSPVPPVYPVPMTTITSSPRNRTGLVFSLAVTATLLGSACIYENPHGRVGYREPAPVVVMVQDDYVYYPEYEVYYSNSRHQYGYRDGNAWAWRPAPVNVSLNVMLSSPSVRMDFHDSPELHHSAVVKSYPRNWKQPANPGHNGKDEHKDDRHDNDKKH
jgi:hypothetical protein